MNIDYQMTLQQYLSEIRNQLADPQTMNPSHIVQKLQTITNSGFQQFIIQTIRTCIQLFQKDRIVLKYAYVADKLLKLPIWNQIMQNVIVQFFCDIFIYLLIQKCFNQIDELKIIRKFWLKTIHPRHLLAMKDIILAEAGIDIDQFYKPEAIGLLKNHYQKKLRLTPQEMNFHLPKTVKTSNAIYQSKLLKTQPQPFVENSNYLITSTPNVPLMNVNLNTNVVRRSVSPEPLMSNIPTPNYGTNFNQNYPNQYYTTNPTIHNQNPYLNTTMPQRISPPIDPRDPRISNNRKNYVAQKHIQQNIPYYQEKNEFINSNYKRERLYSEETRTSMNAEYMMSQAQIQPQHSIYGQQNYERNPQSFKKVHYNEDIEILKNQPERKEKEFQKPKPSKILQMLRNDKVYKCKQCGKGYKCMTEYEKHLKEHFQEKMLIKEKKKQNIKLLNFDEWTMKGSNNSFQQFDQFYITVSNLSSREQKQSKQISNIKEFQALQLKCRLCNQNFDLKFYVDDWVLSNATFCDLNGKKIPMHKTCQQALEQSSSDQIY